MSIRNPELSYDTKKMRSAKKINIQQPLRRMPKDIETHLKSQINDISTNSHIKETSKKRRRIRSGQPKRSRNNKSESFNFESRSYDELDSTINNSIYDNIRAVDGVNTKAGKLDQFYKGSTKKFNINLKFNQKENDELLDGEVVLIKMLYYTKFIELDQTYSTQDTNQNVMTLQVDKKKDPTAKIEIFVINKDGKTIGTKDDEIVIIHLKSRNYSQKIKLVDNRFIHINIDVKNFHDFHE